MSIKAKQLRGGGGSFGALGESAAGDREAVARSQALDNTGRVRRASTAPLDAIVFNPLNPRRTIVEETIDEMAESLRRGQITPITVISRDAFLDSHPDQVEAIGDAAFIALDGNRRLRAARRAGLASLRVDLNDDLASSAADMLESALIANIHREDVPPVEEAHAINELMTRLYGGKQADVARALSKSPQWVGQRLALLHLTPDVQSLVESGDLKVKEARKIGASARAGKLTSDQQQAAAEEAIAAAAAPRPRAAEPRGVNPVYSGGASGATAVGGAEEVNPVYTSGQGTTTGEFQATAGPVAASEVNPVYSEGQPLPEPRSAPGASPVIVSLDPEDITATARAIRAALDVRQTARLAEALINSLRNEQEYSTAD